MKKQYIIAGALFLVAAAVGIYFLLQKDLSGNIVIPYIAHQKPQIDPHLPEANPLSDKLDEVLFDGIFNLSANPSGITHEDGLGELISIEENIITIKLRKNKKWHDSYFISHDEDEIKISEKTANYFSAKDLQFTLDRIKKLGSLSPDYILVAQALEEFNFEGPDINNEIRFTFKTDRIWNETDIKDVLSFKILPAGSEIAARHYKTGSGPYMTIDHATDVSDYVQNLDGDAIIPNVKLQPFIDNSTFTTEISNNNINVLLSTPFGSLSPILADNEEYFTKSNISTTFFAVLFNTERLDRTQRIELRKLLQNRVISRRFFKVGTEQQRHIYDYKGNKDNYDDYLNTSVFPSSSYYIEEQVVIPAENDIKTDISILPDTVRIKVCLNFGFREEFRELIEILNDPVLFKGKIRATAVKKEDIKLGSYDAVLVAVSGYSSKFLFDLYDIFLRDPDLARYKINLQIKQAWDGTAGVSPESFYSGGNFFRLDTQRENEDKEQTHRLLEYVYEFMATREIGDKQQYAIFIDQLEHEMALGSWLFSLPSLAYFSTQFDAKTIDLYGVASQLSTIEKWDEKKDD
jgi:hypothetical protein